MWKKLPIFINNRNRLSTTKSLAEWLMTAGCNNIYILDNDSNYPPLLEWYDSIEKEITVLKLGKNIGPWSFWLLELHKEQSTPYLVTDSDLLPAEFCSIDLIKVMYDTLLANPNCGKVGTGLRIDALPDTYRHRQLAYEWESQFWHRPFSRGLFHAPIDTTFAIYPAYSNFVNNSENIRLGYPYIMEHMPWHVDEDLISEEEKYYRKNASQNFIHWGAKSDDNKLESIKTSLTNERRPTVLHLGCGNEYIPGWTNIDLSGRKIDIEFDLDKCRTQTLPLAENSVDGFYMCHALEHIDDTLALMQELHRVARHDAKLFARMPYGSSDDAWEDPSQKRAWFENSFLYFSQPAYSRADYKYNGDWQCKKIILVVNPDIYSLGQEKAYSIIKTQRNIVKEMIVELHAVKPSRERRLDLLQAGQVIITTDPRVEPCFKICMS
jgi:SAM-dependent methyltransferase